MTNQKFISTLIYFAFLIVIVAGCAPLRPDTNPLLDKKAFDLSTRARSFNQHIKAAKGTAWARLETKTHVEKFKIAWAAVFPNKIRITFLLSGHPIETIVATGEKITFLSHTGKHTKYSYYSKDPDMKDYIHIPIKLSDMILVLLGRLPVKKFDDAYFSPSDASLSTITLGRTWKSATQYLHVNSKGKVAGLKMTDYEGTLLYDMTIIKYKTYNFGDIPIQIKLKDKDNKILMLSITNFLPNPPIKESVFQLTESR